MNTNFRKGFWFVIAAWGLTFTTAFAAKIEENASKDWVECAKEDIVCLPADVFSASRDMFLRRDNMTALLLAARGESCAA